MGCLEGFGLRYLRGELPPWFYSVFLANQSVALFKDSGKVAVWPIGVKHTLVRSLHREVVKQNRGEIVRYLEPEQLALSKGGGQKLVFCVRTLLEENPGFVAYKLDIKNAQNCISRATCLEEFKRISELHHLLWHIATTLGPHMALTLVVSSGGKPRKGSLKGTLRPPPYIVYIV